MDFKASDIDTLKKHSLFCAKHPHKHIMPYLNCISEGSEIYLIFPKSEGPFIDFLLNKQITWSEKNLIPFFKQILKGLEFLNTHNITTSLLTPSDNIHVTYFENEVKAFLQQKFNK